MGELAAQFLTLAERQRATVPQMIGHRLMGMTLLNTGAPMEGRAHLDRAIALYDPAEHRALATRFGQDIQVAVLSFRSLALWVLGHSDAALADVDHALKDAREIGQAPTLMYALVITSFALIDCGDFALARAQLEEVLALATEKGTLFWNSLATAVQGWLFGVTGKVSDAVQWLDSGIAGFRSTGSTVWMPLYLARLASAHAELGQFDDARRCIVEAISMAQANKESLWLSELNRNAGEITLLSPESDGAKARAYFERALEIARAQRAKSFELRAAMSMARLWRDQGKQPQAHDLLSQVYGWFTEGFDTLDLKQAKALLDELR
jgi:predicted ATPase